MDAKFIEFAQSWDELNRALGVMLVAQPSKMSDACAAVEAARERHAVLVSALVRDNLKPPTKSTTA